MRLAREETAKTISALSSEAFRLQLLLGQTESVIKSLDALREELGAAEERANAESAKMRRERDAATERAAAASLKTMDLEKEIATLTRELTAARAELARYQGAAAVLAGGAPPPAPAPAFQSYHSPATRTTAPGMTPSVTPAAPPAPPFIRGTAPGSR